MILRRDIPGLLQAETFVTAWPEWRRWKRFGFMRGVYGRERPGLVTAIEICEQEHDLFVSERTRNPEHGER